MALGTFDRKWMGVRERHNQMHDADRRGERPQGEPDQVPQRRQINIPGHTLQVPRSLHREIHLGARGKKWNQARRYLFDKIRMLLRRTFSVGRKTDV